MERKWLLLLTAAILAASSHFAQPARASEACGLGLSNSGACVSAGLGPGGVELGAGATTGGSDGQTSPSRENADGAPDGRGSGDEASGASNPTQITDSLGTCRSDRCGNTGTPSITLTDLASFSPTTPTIHMEPDGWALRGRPANAIAQTTTNTHDGTLLGHPVTVRFTPTAYRWDWGDGTRDSFHAQGSTWEDLGLPRFSETDTSHTYTQRGTVTVTLSIDYTVDYRTDTGTDPAGWTPVTGTVAATTTSSTYVGTAQTVNVPDDCNARPDAPGC